MKRIYFLLIPLILLSCVNGCNSFGPQRWAPPKDCADCNTIEEWCYKHRDFFYECTDDYYTSGDSRGPINVRCYISKEGKFIDCCGWEEQDDTILNNGNIFTGVSSPTQCPVGTLRVQFERFHESAGVYTGDVVWRLTDSNGANIFIFSDNADVNTFDQYGGTPNIMDTAYWDGITPWEAFWYYSG